jgi:hypothetical protein
MGAYHGLNVQDFGVHGRIFGHLFGHLEGFGDLFREIQGSDREEEVIMVVVDLYT